MADSKNQDKAHFGSIIQAYMELLREHGEEAVNDMARDAYNKHIEWINAQPKYVINWEEFKKIVPEHIGEDMRPWK